MTDDAAPEVGVVTCFLRYGGDVLLLRRNGDVGSDAGWGAVAGRVEGDPDAATREEIREETGLDPDDVSLVRAGEPFPVGDPDRDTRWRVHPYLFDAATRTVETTRETAEYAWAPPTEIRRRPTVPGLWTAYDRVRPSVETIAADREHGSAHVSVRALEVLRDEAALAGDRENGGGGVDSGESDGTGTHHTERSGWAGLAALARRLRSARPAMPVVENRVDRAIADASDEQTPAAVEAAATAGIDRALAADDRAAAVAADRVGSRVGTLSRSGTVLEAIQRADPGFVLVAASRPGREGVTTAEAVAARTGASVTVTTDAAFGGALADAGVETLLVGADAVLSDGRVVNKVGTRSAAAAAAREELDCYVVAASDKVTRGLEFDPEPRDPAECYDGDADLTVANPTFEATPPDYFDGVLTERGALGPADVRDLAATHRTHAAWVDEA